MKGDYSLETKDAKLCIIIKKKKSVAKESVWGNSCLRKALGD